MRDDRWVLSIVEGPTMISVLLVLILGILVTIAVGIWRLTDEVERTATNVNTLRLSGRTVQRQAILRDTELTEERSLTRLGRSTKSRRLVVGGDQESELHQQLSRGIPHDVDDE